MNDYKNWQVIIYSYHETLSFFAILNHFPKLPHGSAKHFFSDREVSSSVVISSVLFAAQQLSVIEQFLICSGANLVYKEMNLD